MRILEVALGLITRDGRWFLQRRGLGVSVLPGRWEFPGGKALPLEPIEAALLRELQEEVKWIPELFTPLPVIEHGHREHQVRLHPFLCKGPGEPRTTLAWGWFTLNEMGRLPIPEANAALLELLR